ncbi:Retrovirus-related Pol polyprotein from transposon [Nosema granulosis]|uniref:Retrovirus-related Pol polyprotein from transposon n=1 Tax=Nosema granulosis TaxID=83296 RepID=A0A9P6KYR8_9MICR|nr:Retrovirus-related Pol polyprotein from transposon [Nosema granulosis]
MRKENRKTVRVDEIDKIDRLVKILCKKGERRVKNYECRITTRPDEIVVTKPIKIPKAIEEKVEFKVQRLLNLGYITPSNSTWLNRVRPVVKDNEKIRLTANLMALNNLVILDKYSLPDMMETLYKLNEKRYKTKIDLKMDFIRFSYILMIDTRRPSGSKTGCTNGQGCPWGLRIVQLFFKG